jgi:hypothetical protein
MSCILLWLLSSVGTQSTLAANTPLNDSNVNLAKQNSLFDFSSWKDTFDTKKSRFSVQLGWFDASQGHSEDIKIEGLIGDNFYSVGPSSSSSGMVGLGYYLEGPDVSRFSMAYGINALYLAKTTVSGTVVQEQLFENLAYHYSLTNWPVYFAAKATDKHRFNDKINVVLESGIGLNLIQSSAFYESPLDESTIPDTIFAGQTTAAFSAMVGVGLKFNNVFGQAPLECGYRFMYLGQSHLKSLSDQVLNPLSTGQSYANALICSITV